MEMKLETGPKHPRTHWQHCRFFFRKPLGVNSGQIFKGNLKMTVNDERSYDVIVKGRIGESEIEVFGECFALHEQQYFNLTPMDYPELSSEYYNLY